MSLLPEFLHVVFVVLHVVSPQSVCFLELEQRSGAHLIL